MTVPNWRHQSNILVWNLIKKITEINRNLSLIDTHFVVMRLSCKETALRHTMWYAHAQTAVHVYVSCLNSYGGGWAYWEPINLQIVLSSPVYTHVM